MTRRIPLWIIPVISLCMLNACGATSAQSASVSLKAAAAQPWPPAPKPRVSRCSEPLRGQGRTLNIGPGQKFTELTKVPWLSLSAGDVVNIFHRAQPYRTKFALRAQGRADAPVVINGVTDAECNLPVISGENAVTATDAAKTEVFEKEWNTDGLGLIFMYKLPFDEYGSRPSHITFQNLKITGANQRNTFVDENGRKTRYERGASGIYAVVADYITLDNLEVTGNGNGIFFNTKSKEETSSHIIVRNSRIFGNGNSGSWHEHNLYVQARRALYEGNYIGQLVPGGKGSSLKDRSSATVVRYNHIDAAARALDLVEIEGGYVTDDPLYPNAWVYGNLIVSDHTRKPRSSTLLIHWGGDNDPRYYRNGTLFFYHNTVKTIADKSDHWYLSMFDLEDEKQTVSVRYNVFSHEGSAEQYLGYESGLIDLNAVNWISPGWVKGQKGVQLNKGGKVLSSGQAVIGKDYRALPASSIVDAAVVGDMPLVKGAAMQNLAVQFEYSEAVGMVARKLNGTAPDLGAFEAAN